MTDSNLPIDEPPRGGSLLGRLSSWFAGPKPQRRRPGRALAGPGAAVRTAALRAAAAKAQAPAAPAIGGGAQIIALPVRERKPALPAFDMAEAADPATGLDAFAPPAWTAPAPVAPPEDCSPLHTAELLVAVVEHEAEGLLRDARARGAVAWSDFSRAWQRLARRVAAGETAADDLFMSDLLIKLRQVDGRPLLHARRKALNSLLQGRIAEHLVRRSPGSLAARLAALEPGPERGSAESAARWILTLDAAGFAAFRTLAVLGSDGPLQARILRDLRQAPGAGRDLAWLQACLTEAGRLWPACGAAVPTPTCRRHSAEVIAPAFNGPEGRLSEVRRFEPALWLDQAGDAGRVVAFPSGAAACQARRLLPTIGAAFLAVLLREGAVAAEAGTELDLDELPDRLDPLCVRLRFG